MHVSSYTFAHFGSIEPLAFATVSVTGLFVVVVVVDVVGIVVVVVVVVVVFYF